MKKPTMVYEYASNLAHYEDDQRRAGRPMMGGAGGKTLCERKFVPRAQRWTRDPRAAVHKRWDSCSRCLVKLAARLGLPVSSPASTPPPRSTP